MTVADFPRFELEQIALGIDEEMPETAAVLRQAVKAHSELSDRCVMDRTEYSLQIAALNLRIRQLEERP